MTVFYELQGQHGREVLSAFALTLAAAGVTSELLESTTQQGLFLLLCRAETAPEHDPPAGARVWQFRAVR